MNQLTGADIIGVIDGLGDNQWDVIDTYKTHGLTFEMDRFIEGRSPLWEYLNKRFLHSWVGLEPVNYENRGGRMNAIHVIDAVRREIPLDLMIRIPYHVMLVEDFWDEMLKLEFEDADDSSIVTKEPF